MTCTRWEHNVFLLSHGQMGGLKRIATESHLQTCPSCRARWARWVVERDSLRKGLAPLPQAGWEENRLLDAVGARIRTEVREGAHRRAGRPAGLGRDRRVRVGLLAAVCVLFGMGISALAANWAPLFGRPTEYVSGAPGHGMAGPVGLGGECLQMLDPSGVTAPNAIPGPRLSLPRVHRIGNGAARERRHPAGSGSPGGHRPSPTGTSAPGTGLRGRGPCPMCGAIPCTNSVAQPPAK